MTEFVGVDRQAILERLVTLYDDVAAGAGPRAVSLEASLGLGKTRVIQELFRHLAGSRQGARVRTAGFALTSAVRVYSDPALRGIRRDDALRPESLRHLGVNGLGNLEG